MLKKEFLRKALLDTMRLAILLALAACTTPPTVTPSPVPTETAPATFTVSPSQTPLPPQPTKTVPEPTQTILPAATSTVRAQTVAPFAPYPDAPFCPDIGDAHNVGLFHTLWDAERGCHYDHEHGTNPFTPEVAQAFPGLDLTALLGGVGIGHTNPSSPAENAYKHGGFKWNVQLEHPQGCSGYESATNGVNGSVIEIHGFGAYNVELEARFHSSAALLRMCNQADPTDYGYLYTVQLQDYGQRVVPYQGDVLPFPDSPAPSFDGGLGPYISIDCIGAVSQCRPSREFILDHNANTASNWTSKGEFRVAPSGSTLFNLLWRVADTYQVLDWNDQTFPFTYIFICSSDGGLTYDPTGCRYNNSTPQVHEISGEIPAAWDNLEGFDTDPRVGRITAEGYVSRFGMPMETGACQLPEMECHPIKMVSAFVGTYGSVLVFTEGKGDNIIPLNPERDIYFCGEVVCDANALGAVPSGWIGPNN